MGIVLVAAGVVLLVGSLARIPFWLGPTGMASLAVLALVASASIVRPPHVYAASHAYPKPHDVRCGSTAVHQALESWSPSDLPASDAMRECRTKGRVIVGGSVAGAASGFGLIAFAVRRRSTDVGSDDTIAEPSVSKGVPR